jgi:hypothetical protein
MSRLFIFVVFLSFYGSFLAQQLFDIPTNYSVDSLADKKKKYLPFDQPSEIRDEFKRPIGTRNILQSDVRIYDSIAKSNRATSCSSTTIGTIPFMDCEVVGTSQFNNTIISEDFDGTLVFASSNSPSIYGSPNPSCWTSGTPSGAGIWNIYDLEQGIENIALNFDPTSTSVAVGAFVTAVWMTFYQGTNCSNLVEVGCELLSDGTFVYDLFIDGLDDSLPLWIYTSSQGGGFIVSDLEIYGFSEVSNDDCATAGGTNEGCNVGAT